MNTMTHSITLKSFDRYGDHVPTDVLTDVLRHVKPLVTQSIAIAFQGSSTPRGRKPDWLAAASDIRLVDFGGSESTSLLFEIPQLGNAAERVYRQQEFWPSKPDPALTGFDLLTGVLRDVTSLAENSDRFDAPILKRLARFGKELQRPFEEVTIAGTAQTIVAHPPMIVEKAEQLRSETPLPVHTRIVGKLDMVRLSTDNFALRLDDGNEVFASIDEASMATVVRLIGQRVVVIGNAVFRPSGHLLRIDADSIFPGENEPAFWSRLPHPASDGINGRQLRQRHYPAASLATLIGAWPGDETDEELIAALDEIE